jgi:hypothetical protein
LAAIRTRCLERSAQLFSAEDCDTIGAARQALVEGAADLVWGGPMYEGEARRVSLELRPRRSLPDPGAPAAGATTIVGFQLAEEMAIALEGGAFSIAPAGFQRLQLAANRRDVAHWDVTPRDGTGARGRGREQVLWVTIKARVALGPDRFVNLDITPHRYPVVVLVRPLSWWQHFWHDLKLVFEAPREALDELAYLFGAIGAVGLAFWAMLAKWRRRRSSQEESANQTSAAPAAPESSDARTIGQ